MEPLSFEVVSAALLIAVGQYAILSKYLGGDFVRRFLRLKQAFTDWESEAAKKFYSDLLDKAADEEPVDHILEFVREWATKNRAVALLQEDYRHLDFVTKLVLGLCSISFLLGVMELIQGTLVTLVNGATGQPISFLGYAVAFLGLAGMAILYYLWKLHALSTVITQFETGTPVADIVGMLARRVSKR
jgi:hypothetical protein